MSELNRRFWDERVPIHTAGQFYDLGGFRAGRRDAAALRGRGRGRRDGPDAACTCSATSGWTRSPGLGRSRVTGLDFSAPAIEAARELAADPGVEADSSAPTSTRPRRRWTHGASTSSTTVGAINWLPDMARWAGVVAALLEPGGVFYMTEVHPFSWVFGDNELTVEQDYFQRDRNDSGEPGTYADLDRRHRPQPHRGVAAPARRRGERAGGRRADARAAARARPRARSPMAVPGGARQGCRMPAGAPRLPLMYSLRARRAP